MKKLFSYGKIKLIHAKREVFMNSALLSKLQNYMQKNNLLADELSFSSVRANIYKQICANLQKNESSLMIPSFISVDGDLSINKAVIVIDAGGTNLRVAKIMFNKQLEAEILAVRKTVMPGSSGLMCTADEFLDVLLDYIQEYYEEDIALAICFSYPAVIQADGDGLIQQFCKEVQISGMDYKLLGKELKRRAAERKINCPQNIYVLNDTVAALLGSLATARKNSYNLGMGYILGTGMNLAYVESTDNIGKLSAQQKVCYKYKSMIINMELGCFAAPLDSKIDKLLDAQSSIPGDHLLEKMMSGKYLGTIFSLALYDFVTQNADECQVCGRLSAALYEAKKRQIEISTVDMSQFMAYFKDGVLNIDNTLTISNNLFAVLSFLEKQDLSTVCELMMCLADAVVKRCAFLMACSVAAGIDQYKLSRSATETQITEKTIFDETNFMESYSLAIDGSTYYLTPKLADYFKLYLKEEILLKEGINVQCLRCEDGNLIGSAIAALIQK